MTTSSLPTIAPTNRAPASWAGVFSLSLGIFALVMAEFLPVSLLPRIAEDLGVTDGAAGQTVTVTAAAAALSALLLPVALPRADRRTVMIALTALAIVSNVLVAAAPSLPLLLISRLLLGVALGGFWALATAMAAHLVPADRLGRALTVVNAGVSIATVAAVPLATWLGESLGWRAVFLIGAAAAAIALVVQLLTLPRVAPATSGGVRALAATLRSGVVLLGLLAVLLIFGGHFTGFTYVRPAAESVSTIDANGLTLLLVVFGVANIAGTAVSGPLADRRLRVAVVLFPVVTALGMLLMVFSGGSAAILFLAATLWGFGFGGVPPAVLTWGARTEPTRMEQIGGVIVTTSQIAIGLGAIVGGALADSVSPNVALVVGALAATVGGLVLSCVGRRNA